MKDLNENIFCSWHHIAQHAECLLFERSDHAEELWKRHVAEAIANEIVSKYMFITKRHRAMPYLCEFYAFSPQELDDLLRGYKNEIAALKASIAELQKKVEVEG